MAAKSSIKLDSRSIVASLKQAAAPIKTHLVLIMFLVLMGTLIYTVLTVSTIIQINDDAEYRLSAEAKSLDTSFDQATIKKVDELRESSDGSAIELPGGRRNPFVD